MNLQTEVEDLNYLYLNNSGQIQTGGTTNINNATKFTISNTLISGTGTGTISTTIDNQTYYLRYNNYKDAYIIAKNKEKIKFSF